jgi:hypothetical protein
MKITVEIGGKDYIFEMNRIAYKRLLADKEYAEMQNELTKRIKAKDLKGKSSDEVKDEVGNDLVNENISALILSNLVMEEQIFYYSLLNNHPEMTIEMASDLLDTAIAEYGETEVSGLTTTLMENFTQRGEAPKKKMVMRMS